MSPTNGTTEEAPTGNFMTLSKHDTYYIPSADLSILVDHIQFKVHRYFFERESKFFAGKLDTPATPGSSQPGLDDPNAIILEHVTPEQFAAFLWVFYNPKYSIYEAPIEKWEIILTLATTWSFPEVKALSLRELEKKIMPDVKRIKLYHQNNVDRNILIPRYAALIEREDPLTEEEGEDLGMRTAVMVARGREEARSARQANGARSPSTPTIHGADLHEAIRALFKISPTEAAVVAEPAPTDHNSTGALPPTEQPTERPPTQQPEAVTQKPPTGSQKAQKSQKQGQSLTTKKGVQKATEQAPPTPQKAKPAPPTTSTNKEKERKETAVVADEKEIDPLITPDTKTEPPIPVPVEGNQSTTAPVTVASDLINIWDDVSTSDPNSASFGVGASSPTAGTSSIFEGLGTFGGGNKF